MIIIKRPGYDELKNFKFAKYKQKKLLNLFKKIFQHNTYKYFKISLLYLH